MALASAAAPAWIRPMAILGSLATVRAQTARMEIFTATFSYLDELFRTGSPASTRLRSAPIGVTKRIELTGGAFALEQVYAAKLRADGFFESHRKFIDVQVVFEGEEAMELADISRLTARVGYDAEKDVIIYADCHDASVLRLGVGDAAVFLPADGHMPGIRPSAAPVLVRKTVIKVPCAPGAGLSSPGWPKTE
jgi:biofilm protein TabA